VNAIPETKALTRPRLARITLRSVDKLGIAPGAAVYAQIKTVALMR